MQEPDQQASSAPGGGESQLEVETTANQEKYASYLLYLIWGLIACCTVYGGVTVWGWLDEPANFTMAEAIFTAILVGLGYFESIVAAFKRRSVLKAPRQRKKHRSVKD